MIESKLFSTNFLYPSPHNDKNPQLYHMLHNINLSQFTKTKGTSPALGATSLRSLYHPDWISKLYSILSCLYHVDRKWSISIWCIDKNRFASTWWAGYGCKGCWLCLAQGHMLWEKHWHSTAHISCQLPSPLSVYGYVQERHWHHFSCQIPSPSSVDGYVPDHCYEQNWLVSKM
jgi:hypothetical protein